MPSKMSFDSIGNILDATSLAGSIQPVKKSTRNVRTTRVLNQQEPSDAEDGNFELVAVEAPPPPIKRTSSRVKGQDFLLAKAEEARLRSEAAIDSRVLQDLLPLWDDHNRGLPNSIIRSGMFSVKTSAAREYLPDLKVASLSNYDLQYKGEELQQSDLSVWMSLINLARTNRIADAVFFSGYEIVKDLGWRMHSESYKKVKESIQRMKVTSIRLGTSDKSSEYAGSLIRDYAFASEDSKEGTTKWMVRFEPRVSNLFVGNSASLIHWEMRKRIGTRFALAQWLHTFYESHEKPIPYSMQKLHELSRSGQNLNSFRKNIQLALQRLHDEGFLTGYAVKDDVIHVQKALLKLSDLRNMPSRKRVPVKRTTKSQLAEE